MAAAKLVSRLDFDCAILILALSFLALFLTVSRLRFSLCALQNLRELRKDKISRHRYIKSQYPCCQEHRDLGSPLQGLRQCHFVSEHVWRNPCSSIHLWLECTLHAMGVEGRIRRIRQVLMICYLSVLKSLEDAPPLYLPHVQGCLQLCWSFQIELQTLGLTEEAQEWVITIAER